MQAKNQLKILVLELNISDTNIQIDSAKQVAAISPKTEQGYKIIRLDIPYRIYKHSDINSASETLIKAEMLPTEMEKDEKSLPIEEECPIYLEKSSQKISYIHCHVALRMVLTYPAL